MKTITKLFFICFMLHLSLGVTAQTDLLANSTEDGDFSEYTTAQTGIWTSTPSTTIWPSNSSWYADGAVGGGGSARTCIRVHNVETNGNYYSKYHYLNIMMDESFSTNTVYGTSVLWRKLTGLTPGATYTFSFYHKFTNALAGKSINFAVTDGIDTDGAYTLGTDGNANSFVKQLNGIVTFSTAESAYAQTSYVFTVPEGKTEVYAVFLRSHKTDKTLAGAMRINIDDMSLYLGVTTSTNSLQADNTFSVYPNPVKDYLNIISTKDIKQILITDLTGRMVMNVSDRNFTGVDVSNLQTGSYLIHLIGEETTVQRFIKK